MSDKPININLAGLVKPQAERVPGQKNKSVPRKSLFFVPDSWDGAMAWSLTWLSSGGLFISLARFILWANWPPIWIPAAAIAGLILFLVEVYRHPCAEVGFALGLVLAGCIVGVLH